MLRLTLLVTAVVSFLHFAFPQSFSFVNKPGDVLGINKLEAAMNSSAVETALQIYCINKGKLPENLNILFGDELTQEKRLDLDKIYEFRRGKDCSFQLLHKD